MPLLMGNIGNSQYGLLKVFMKRAVKNEQIFIDPVCYKKLTVSNCGVNQFITYRMRTYYFCTRACRKVFELNPDKYLNQKISREKGLGVRYLDRLKQLAGHKIF